MTPTDWAPVIQACALLVTSVVIPWGIREYQRRTGIQLTAQQQATFVAAAGTVTGLIENKLNTGELKAADVHPDNPTIQALAADAIARIPETAAALGSGVPELAAIAAAKVDTGPAGNPAFVIKPAA